MFSSFGIAMLGTIIATQFTKYQNASVSGIHNPATSLGQQFTHTVTLPGSPKVDKGAATGEEAPSAAPVGDVV